MNMTGTLPKHRAKRYETICAECSEPWPCEFERQREQLAALSNNAERVIAILTPLFVKAQEADSPDEEALGGALDVLTGWFGQNGLPLGRLEDIDKLRAALTLANEVIIQAREVAPPSERNLLPLNLRYLSDAVARFDAATCTTPCSA
jgi:hypothetical protein